VLLPEAYRAAPAIEHDFEWVTLDGDFSRFAGLKWCSPC
jgi:predicted nucleic acid-binding protein